jgi:predicted PurR-regulated permease PerM
MPTTTTNRCKFKFILLIIIASLVFLYYLSPILTPFVLGTLLAYICNPLVNKLIKYTHGRTLAVVLVFCLLFFIILLLILLITPLVQQQVAALVGLIPTTVDWMQTSVFPWLNSHLGTEIDGNIDVIKNLPTENLIQIGPRIIQTMLASGKTLVEVIIDIIFTPVITFYLLRDWDSILTNIKQLIPRKYAHTVIQLAQQCDAVLNALLRGQLLVMLALGIFYAIALSLIGLKVGVGIGMIVGIVSIMPYLGLIIGLLIACMAALVQFGSFSALIWVFIIFAIGHTFENVYLTPKLIGSRIGLHPVAVIFAILAGGALFGFLGVLLALPVAAIVLVVFSYLREHYLNHKRITQNS